MPRKQRLSIRAYSFSLSQYRSKGADKVFPLNSEMKFSTAEGEDIAYSSAMDLFKEFIDTYTFTGDNEYYQQLFRCNPLISGEGETEQYKYLFFNVFSGYYGFPSEVIDRNTKRVVLKKTKDQADVREFYVMIAIPKDTTKYDITKGIIFFQEIGVYGIKTVTASTLQSFLSSKLNLSIHLKNLAPDFYLKKLFDTGIVKKIHLARNIPSADSVDQLYGFGINREERALIPFEISAALKRQLKHVAEAKYHFFSFDDKEYPEVKMEVRIGDRTRKIDLHGLDDLSIEEALPDELLLADGVICFDAFKEHMLKVASEYLDHLPCY